MVYSILIYTISFLCTFSLLYLYEKKDIKNKYLKFISLFLCFTPIIILFTMRTKIGSDYNTYKNLFNNIKNTPISLDFVFKHYVEAGWVLLTYLSLLFSKSFHFFQFLVSIIFFIYFTMLIEKEENKKLYFALSFVLIFFPFMNITRQILALIICYYSLKKVMEKKYVVAIINILIASLFHKSALIFLFVIALYYAYDKLPKKIFKIGEYILLFSPIYAIPLSYVIKEIFKALHFQTNYIHKIINLDFKFLLYTLLIIGIYKYIIKKEKIDDKKSNLYFLYVISLISILMKSLGFMMLTFERLAIYFFGIYILLFPMLYKQVKNKKIFNILVYGYLIIYFILMYIILNGQGCFPYSI